MKPVKIDIQNVPVFATFDESVAQEIALQIIMVLQMKYQMKGDDE